MTRRWGSAAGLIALVCAVAAGAVFGLRSLAGPQSAQGDAERRDLGQAWDSPAGVARAQRIAQMNHQPFPLHGFSDGLAVAPGANLVVAATPGAQVNQLDVIDTRARTAWRIAHPNARIGLIEPTVSADGQRLAFVVGLPSTAGEFTGVSALWVTDRDGHPVRVVATPNRLYRDPVFSPDGKHLAYFRDVFEAETDGRALPPENQSAKPMTLFEVDLATGREIRLLQQAYAGGGRIAYDPAGSDLFYVAGPRLKPIKDRDRTVWLPSDDFFKAVPLAPAHIPLQLHRFERTQGVSKDVGGTLKQIPGRNQGAFMGLTPTGAVALYDADDQPDHLDWKIFLADRSDVRSVVQGRDRDYLGQPALSADGGAFAALSAGAIGEPATNPPKTTLIVFGHFDRPDRVTRLNLRDVRFRADPVLLDASLPPTHPP